MNDITLAIVIFTLCVLGLSKLVKNIFEKYKKKISFGLVLGVVDVSAGLLVLGLALWDILTPGGDLNGMLGQLLLIILEPTALVILVCDIVVCLIKKSR